MAAGCKYFVGDNVYTEREFKEYLLKEGYDKWASEGVLQLINNFKEISGVTHAQTQEIREELGMPEYESTPETQAGWDAEAEQKIKDGYNVAELISDMKEKTKIPTKVEQKILAKYIGMLRNKVSTDPSDKNLKDLKDAMEASELIAGSEVGKSLAARKGIIPVDDSLAGYFVAEMEASGVDKLTDEQKATVRSEYDAIKKAHDEYVEKVAKLQEENAKLKAQQVVSGIREKRKSTRKTSQEFTEERKKIVEDIREKLKKARSETSAVAVPYLKELIVISPDVAKLVASLVEQGVTKLEDVIDQIHETLLVDIDGITKKDVQDLIAGEYAEPKKTKGEIAATVRDLKTEAQLLNKLEALERGEEPKTEKAKVEKNQKIKKLQDEIKNYKNLEKELKNEQDKIIKLKAKESGKLEKELQKAEFEQGINLDSDYANDLIKKVKERTNSEIKKLEEQLNSGDFDVKKPQPKLKLDAEGKELKKKLIKLRVEREVRLLKKEYDKRNALQKFRDKVTEVFNIPRAIMASSDFSAPLNQSIVATTAYPKIAKEAAKQMFKSAFSQEEFDNWFFDLKEDPRYDLMKELKLGITDPHSPFLTAKEEAFMSGYAEMVGDLPGKAISKVTGKNVSLNFIKGSERAYVQYLNKMRVDLFNKFVDKFEDKGLLYEKNKKLYEETAKYINNITGRGNVGKLEAYAPVFNALFFSPRLMASRINMLNPFYWGRLPKEVRKLYFKDMGSLLALGSTVLGLFALYGSTQDDEDKNKITVETDPRSSDYGKIKQGDTRWNIWGGFQPYVRIAAQLSSGEKKSTVSGQVTELDGNSAFGETRSDIIARFFRGKLAPVPSIVADLFSGKTATGEDVTIKDELYTHLIPLSAQGIAEAWKQYGPLALANVGLPSIFGIGTQTYGEKKKEVPGKIPFHGDTVKLTDEQKEYFQQVYDKNVEQELKKVRAIPEYKTWDRNYQVAAEARAKTSAMTKSRQDVQKKYKNELKNQEKETKTLPDDIKKTVEKTLKQK